MISMAVVTTNARLPFTQMGTLFHEERTKGLAMEKVAFCKSWDLVKPKWLLSILVKASMEKFQSLDMISGKKVNGVYVGNRTIIGSGPEIPRHACLIGRFMEDKYVYRQAFIIRSYEIEPNKTATMETFMNLLQETTLNHVMSSSLAGNGFSATWEMSLRKLIRVITRNHVQVERYSS
ncbi:hypothetical protein SLA2020_040170 [Shorea laevis]